MTKNKRKIPTILTIDLTNDTGQSLKCACCLCVRVCVYRIAMKP